MTRRWIIVLTAEDGTTNAWGSWGSSSGASRAADALRQRSAVYTGDDSMPSYHVATEWVEKWPGLPTALAELGLMTELAD